MVQIVPKLLEGWCDERLAFSSSYANCVFEWVILSNRSGNGVPNWYGARMKCTMTKRPAPNGRLHRAVVLVSARLRALSLVAI